MKILNGPASDEEILALVRDWVGLLAAKDYDAAFALTEHDPYYGWTPPRIRRVVEGYGSLEPTPTAHQVTPIAEASGGPAPRHQVSRWEEPQARTTNSEAIGEVWFDLPLDGSWSDLTATFEVRRRDERLLLVLNEIHVF